ncbi:MAG: site-specific integrase [Planctomycetota bacterium]|nr:MAG: site-specific integrase [Planctomycetota bacterium]
MFIRSKTKNHPMQVCWRVRAGDQWRERAVAVNRKNLLRYDVQPPAPGAPITERHAKRLQAALERLGLDTLPESTAGANGQQGPPSGPLTLADAAKTYLSALEVTPGQLRRKRRTLMGGELGVPDQLNTRSQADVSFLGLVGNLPLEQLRRQDVEAYESLLRKAGYAEQTVRSYLVDVRSFLNWSVREGLLPKTPAQGHHLPPSEPAGDLYILTADQVRKLLQVLGDPLAGHAPRAANADRTALRNGLPPRPFGSELLSAPLQAALFLGLRRSEIVKLRWVDVDLFRRVVNVRGARKNPQRAERRRPVPIPPELLPYFKRAPRRGEFAFANSDGNPWDTRSIHCAMKRFREVWEPWLGFQVGFQCLRRTYGSLLYAAGYGLDQVADFLGHSEASTTRIWYAKLVAEDQHDRIAQAFEQLRKPAAGDAAGPAVAG